MGEEFGAVLRCLLIGQGVSERTVNLWLDGHILIRGVPDLLLLIIIVVERAVRPAVLPVLISFLKVAEAGSFAVKTGEGVDASSTDRLVPWTSRWSLLLLCE